MSVGGTTAIGTISLGWVGYAFICAFVRGGALIVGVASVANIRVLAIGGKSISDKREIGTLHINSNLLAIILSKRAKESPSIRPAAKIISYISFAFGMASRRNGRDVRTIPSESGPKRTACLEVTLVPTNDASRLMLALITSP